ncbi:gliding motility-associated C-terminal domain-containing protein [Flectobacillus sp. DC10W]|uniref:Gliding motility-associated C-terminal domain-containing protein n=1 Tax=Flectobacillus longus TaxID=2984207 RepID=A0ABT6YVG2_9BACT|nr:gliding motility-associated C-terminal domain-containing protein [Flectobacillus longus]MDI9867592.1 gliding motility-associated C-terminal domain-containing protein [Flectobacillus longus]
MPSKIYRYIAFFVVLFFFNSPLFALNAKIEGGATGICPNNSVRLTIDNPDDYKDYKWYFYRVVEGDWTTFTLAAGAYADVSDPGKYMVKATSKITGNPEASAPLDVPMLVGPASVITPSIATNQICKGNSLDLNANVVPNAHYNWLIDELPLNIDASILKATKAGVYKLVVIGSNNCPTTSAPYTITYFPLQQPVITSVPTVCGVSTAGFNLSVNYAGGTFRGPGITNISMGFFSPQDAKVGTHKIFYSLPQNNSCPNLEDSVQIVVKDPQVTLTSNTGGTDFCNGQPASLQATTGFVSYEWSQNSTVLSEIGSKLSISTDGDYKVVVSDGECSAEKLFTAKFVNQVQPKITNIPSVCGLNYPAVMLEGAPIGGVFTINGTNATQFDYAKLGVGKHTVNYEVRGTLSCLNGTASQEVVIHEIPKIEFARMEFMWKGSSVTLQSNYTDPTYLYTWTPNVALSDPKIPTPIANPTATQTYTLKVESPFSSNCSDEKSVDVVVFEKIWIPDVFTPNGDGFNDTWELTNITAYPNAEVRVFNRWGEIAYYSYGNYGGFDGTYNGSVLPMGTYTYHIIPFPDHPELELKGTLAIFR